MISVTVRRPGRLILSLIFVAACVAFADPPSSIAQSLVDRGCPGGTGTAISVSQSWLAGAPFVVTEMLPSGSTLVVTSAGYPSASFAVADAFTSDCSPDRTFGSRGAERLVFGGQVFSIAAAIPAPGDGIILAGSTAKGWLVARLDARGRLDTTFGSGGWSVLPWPGSAVRHRPDAIGRHRARRQPRRGLLCQGMGRRAERCMAAWSASSAQAAGNPSPVPGDVTPASHGFGSNQMGTSSPLPRAGTWGAGGYPSSALTSSGSPVPSFRSNFTAAMRHVSPSGIFVGDVVARSTDFLLLGTEQSTCVTTLSSRTAHGRVAAFQLNGKLEPRFAAHGEESFNSPIAQPVWALPRNNGGFVMAAAPVSIQSNPHARAELRAFMTSPPTAQSITPSGRMASPTSNCRT